MIKEDLVPMEEPFDDEGAPGPTQVDGGSSLSEDPLLADDEETQQGVIPPEDSFYPPNDEYDYAPDVMLTGNPNNGVIYPAGAALEQEEPEQQSGEESADTSQEAGQQEEDLSEEQPESDLGLVERKIMKNKKYNEAIKLAKRNLVNSKKALEIARKFKERDSRKGIFTKSTQFKEYETYIDEDGNEFDDEGTLIRRGQKGGEGTTSNSSSFSSKPGRKKDMWTGDDIFDESLSGSEINKLFKGKKGMKTRKSAIIAAKNKIKEAKRIMREFDFEVGDEYDIESPAVDGEEMIDGEEIEKTEEDIVQDILADAEELYAKITSESEFDEMGEEEDDLESSEEMLESRKTKIKRKILEKRLKRKIQVGREGRVSHRKDKIKEAIAKRLAEKRRGRKVPSRGDDDVFFDEAKKRSLKRKAYLAKILNEEDTPTLGEQPEVEELLGLKIIKKIGEDPKLVESKSKKFEETYKKKQSLNFKSLLEKGFLG